MGLEKILFYLFSLVLIFSATMVITVRNSVRAILFLVLAFFTSAGLWLMLEAEFLAIVLVLVYVGAVMVLFLFVVMMLDVDRDQAREGFGRHLPVGLLVAGIIIVEMVAVLNSGGFATGAADNLPAQVTDSNVKEIGRVLYTHYVYPFELAAVILLIGMIAAITLTFRGKRQTKYVAPHQQLKARKAERLRVVQMASEIGEPAETRDSSTASGPGKAD